MRACLLLAVTAAATAPNPDAVTTFPGWDDALRSAQYSGLLTGSSAARQLHYHLVESEGNPASDPLVIWLNGGPGCSSMIGFWLEQGPFTMGGDGIIVENPSRWNVNANMLFLETPPGVGFSYLTDSTPLPYVADDHTTAADSLAALLSFYVKFPQFANSSLWISGESYAGVYVPMLAQAILASPQASSIALKGVLVGNGALKTSPVYEGGLVQQRMQHAYNHGLFSTPLYDSINAACVNYTAPSASCSSLLSTMAQQVGPLNAYDIEVTCLGGGVQQRALMRSAEGSGAFGAGFGPLGDACSVADSQVTAYMNRVDVQAAFHVTAAAAVLGPWSECASGSTLSYTRIPQDETQTVYPGLIAKIAVLVFNGDQDECIPYLQDQAWTRAMGYPVKEEWRPWLLDEQVAGYVTEFSAPVRFAFVTVKRAGHEVPMYQPERALSMLQRFINGQAF
jgi:serine carboxypeptidase-like clade 1